MKHFKILKALWKIRLQNLMMFRLRLWGPFFCRRKSVSGSAGGVQCDLCQCGSDRKLGAGGDEPGDGGPRGRNSVSVRRAVRHMHCATGTKTK